MKKISIIVPFLNAEKCIEKCIESLLKQSYKNIEIVLVNDNSTDNSESLIQKYFSNEKIKYYKVQEDTIGNARARNLGIDKATGDYFIFVDVDDYIDNDLLTNLSKYIIEDYDLIKYKITYVLENNEENKKVIGPVFENLTGEEAFNKLCFEDVLLDSPCAYLIKKDLFTNNNLRFKENTYHEDFGLMPKVILSAKKVISINLYGYFYVQSNNSIMRDEKKNLKKAYDKLSFYDDIVKDIENLNIDKITKENILIFYTNSLIMSLKDLNGDAYKEFLTQMKKRKLYRNIKIRNFKQLIKKIIFFINM